MSSSGGILCIVLLILCYNGVFITSGVVGATCTVQDEWAVVIHGGIDTANKIAETHGFTCLGQIGNLIDHYRFIHNKKNGSDEEINDYRKQLQVALESHKQVASVQYQERLRRVTKRYTIPKDPKWKNQWTLNNTGQVGPAGLDLNVERAWLQGVNGSGALVGVIDTGLQWSDKDIRQNYDAKTSYDFVDNKPDPTPADSDVDGGHGTNCAGTIAMVKNNDVCGVGVAYESKVAGLRIGLAVKEGTTDAQEASALGHMDQDIMISSNSWGPGDGGLGYSPAGPLVTKTLKTGALKGRRGKGTIYVWASGNGGGEGSYDSCGSDGFINSIYTIGIGSADQNGFQADYDENCTSKMAVTYSFYSKHYTSDQLISIDLKDKCIDDFTGTSASTPVVSGVIALALGRNPSLSWRDVQYLIAYTSDWTKLRNTQWTTNGAGLKVNTQFGFGTIDAEAFVTRAKYWTSVPEQKNSTVVKKVTNQHIDHNEEYTLPFNATSLKYTEHVLITVNYKMITTGKKEPFDMGECHVPATHPNINNPCDAQKEWPNRGDVSITLVSPAGTHSTVMQNRRCDICQDGLDDWTFMSVHFWGENPVGTWKMVVKYDGSSGYLELSGNQVLQIYGVTETPQSVQRIPSSCDPACVRGCAASGSQYCDSCKNYRDPVTLECLDSCNKTAYNGYCLDYNPLQDL